VVLFVDRETGVEQLCSLLDFKKMSLLLSDLVDALSSYSVAVTTIDCIDIPFMKRNRHLLQHLGAFVVLCSDETTYSLLAQVWFYTSLH
jgi:hypothetical protein